LIAGAIGSTYTGIDVNANDCVVFGNTISAVLNGSPIVNQGANNLISPIIDAGNFQGECDPCANIAH